MPATTKKRVSDANEDECEHSDDDYSPKSVPTKKRARTSKSSKSNTETTVNVEGGRDLVTRILANPTFPILTDKEKPMDPLLLVAQYARYLENVASASTPPKLSKEQILAAAEKLRKAARSQIKKQMTWKPSCKTGLAKWSYDGIATNPESFASLLNLDKVDWKQKKFTVDEFTDALDSDMTSSVRYDMLYLTYDINTRWNPSTGEFKFSGTYGKLT